MPRAYFSKPIRPGVADARGSAMIIYLWLQLAVSLALLVAVGLVIAWGRD